MVGLSLDHVRRAVDGGWRRDTLIVLNGWLKKMEWEVTAVTPWVFFVGGSLMIYSSYSPHDVERAFAPPTSTEPIKAYTDGSGTTMDKPAGIGVVVYKPKDAPEFIAENIGPGSNNRAELLAIWRALRACPDVTVPLQIYSDSEYAIGSCTKDWTPKANEQIITALRYDLMLRSTPYACGGVLFEHVPGHRNIEGNEIADKLANIGRKIVTVLTPYP